MNRGRPGWLGMDQGRLDILKDPERLACVPETTAALILELVDAFDELTTADDLKRGQLENAKMAASHNLHDVAVLHEQRREWTETRKRLTRDWKTALGQRDEWRALAESCEVSPEAVAKLGLTLVTALAGYREGHDDADPEWPDDVESDNERAAYICNVTIEPWHCLRWLVANAGRLAADALEAETGGES